MKQPVFGSFRVIGNELLESAGEAAEGLEAVYPFDPTRDDPLWLGFRQRFEKQFQAKAEVFASLAYDSMNILVMLKPNKGLPYLCELFQAGKLMPVIEGPYRFSQAREAFRLFEAAKHRGKIVITIE